MLDSQVINDVYDIIFKNYQYDLTDFVSAFPGSYIDQANAKIYLCDIGGNDLFKISIEKV